MKQFIFFTGIALILTLCATGTQGQLHSESSGKVKTAIIQEVLQTSNYTYLRVASDTSLQWLAVPSMDIKAGDTCYYTGGLVMPDFKSKELNKTFDRVIFMEGVSRTPEVTKKTTAGVPEHGTKSKPDKAKVSVEPATGGITIAELFQNPENYNGQVVKIRGQIVKFNPGILGKNWVHLQDGTSFGNKFDLVATLDSTVSTGEVVTLECKVTLNKDFGSGYFFDVILEDAVIK